MKVNIFNQQKDFPIPRKIISAIANQVVLFEKKSYDEVSIHFVTRRAISKLHQEYFNDSSLTDCISFPMDSEEEPGYKILGEVFICPWVALEYAKRHRTDAEHEVMLYLIHGLLHLLGYDDLNPIERLKMRAAEKRHMKKILCQKVF